MIIITGSSPKQQALGQRNEMCPACKQETPHRLQRQYAVKHLFWFPLFSTGTSYATICERCNLAAQTSVPLPGSVPPAPALHRMGFLVPLGVLMFPFFMLPLLLLAGAGSGGSGGSHADTPSARDLFAPVATDRAVEKNIQGQFDEMGLYGLSVRASSADAGDKKIRLIAAKYSRLKKVSDGDRVRLLQMMEAAADESFPDDEVFLGIQARILWGGYSHRAGGQKWSRKVKESTDSPERNAAEAVVALQAAAARNAPASDAATATAAAGVPAH
jgi:hypothetical protein